MKTSTLLFAAIVAVPISLQAQSIPLPGVGFSATSPLPSLNPTVSVSAGVLVNADIDITNSGTASFGNYSASARGGASISLTDPLGPDPGIDLRTQTQFTSGSIKFNSVTTTSGAIDDLLDALDLGNVVGAGLVQEWGASILITALNLSPSTTYELSFDLSQSTSLLNDISPAIFNSFFVTVGDDSGTYGQGALPAGLLGITELTSFSGRATLTFTTDAVINGDVYVSFGAQDVADTDLLGDVIGEPDPTLYTISDIVLNAAVPEPSALVLSVTMAGIVVMKRRRRA